MQLELMPRTLPKPKRSKKKAAPPLPGNQGALLEGLLWFGHWLRGRGDRGPWRYFERGAFFGDVFERHAERWGLRDYNPRRGWIADVEGPWMAAQSTAAALVRRGLAEIIEYDGEANEVWFTEIGLVEGPLERLKITERGREVALDTMRRMLPRSARGVVCPECRAAAGEPCEGFPRYLPGLRLEHHRRREVKFSTLRESVEKGSP